jgi:hypothetical protein
VRGILTFSVFLGKRVIRGKAEAKESEDPLARSEIHMRSHAYTAVVLRKRKELYTLYTL